MRTYTLEVRSLLYSEDITGGPLLKVRTCYDWSEFKVTVKGWNILEGQEVHTTVLVLMFVGCVSWSWIFIPVFFWLTNCIGFFLPTSPKLNHFLSTHVCCYKEAPLVVTRQDYVTALLRYPRLLSLLYFPLFFLEMRDVLMCLKWSQENKPQKERRGRNTEMDNEKFKAYHEEKNDLVQVFDVRDLPPRLTHACFQRGLRQLWSLVSLKIEWDVCVCKQ